ncbi:MAG: hypothetical protein ACRDTH_11005 [Pseudonocardiaceae bacterium]
MSRRILFVPDQDGIDAGAHRVDPVDVLLLDSSNWASSMSLM